MNTKLYNKICNYIESDIDLIDDNKFEQFFNDWNAGGAGNILYEAGIDFLNYVSKIPNRAFIQGEIKDIIIPNNIKIIGEYAFSCCDFSYMGIPESVHTIEKGAFSGCQNLISIDLPDSITTIGDGAFENCENLKSIKLPKNITYIPHRMFAFCYALSDIILPNTIKDIGYRAFFRCDSLKSIKIPHGVTTLSSDLFKECAVLENISFSNNIKVIENGAFENLQLPHVHIHYAGTKDEWRSLYNPHAFKNTYFTVHCSDGKIVKRKK